MSPIIQDTARRFLFEEGPVRGEIVTLQESYQTVMEKHHYPPVLQSLLGELISASILMASTIKYNGQLTVQFQSNESLKLLLVKVDSELNFRALAQYEPRATEDELKTSFDEGQLVITIESKDKVKPYQSIVPVQHQRLSSALSYYFKQSEQLDTQFFLAANDKRAAGLLLQALPQASAQNDHLALWEEVSLKAKTLSKDELLQYDAMTILQRLFVENTLRLFDDRAVQFTCPCSNKRMLQGAKTLGYEDMKAYFNEYPLLTMTCEFCLQQYDFTRSDIEALFTN